MTTYRVMLADRVVDTIVYVSEKSEECVRKDVIKFDEYPESVKVRKERTYSFLKEVQDEVSATA